LLVYPSPQWRIISWWVVILSLFTGVVVWLIFYIVWSYALEWGIVLTPKENLMLLFRRLTGGVVAALIGSLLVGAGVGALVGLFVTHKVVGPLYRLKGAINEIIQGRQIDEMKIRKGDELWDLIEEFNKMVKSIKKKDEILLKIKEKVSQALEKKTLKKDLLKEILKILEGGESYEN